MNKILVGEENLALENKREVKLKYFLLEESKIIEETGESKNVYGIEVLKSCEKEIEKEVVTDVTTLKENAISITNSLMKNRVMPIHLKDVIADML